jgi:hypothetical protein
LKFFLLETDPARKEKRTVSARARISKLRNQFLGIDSWPETLKNLGSGEKAQGPIKRKMLGKF